MNSSAWLTLKSASWRQIIPARRQLLLLFALALAALPAASPYFGDGLPRTNDLFPHLFRALALDRMVQAGVLWPRWSPDLVHGYGYPVFNFFPSLSHLVVELFHLPGLPLTTAYRLTVLAHFVVTAWSAYFLGQALVGPAGGWVAALAYTYSPYLLYDAHVRGGLPESQALALLPLLLLALWRAAAGRRGWTGAAGFIFAALFLSHFPVTFQIALVAGVWLLLLALFQARSLGLRWGWRALVGPGVGLGLGALLTAFFWLPALAEIDYTRAAVSISQGYGYQVNFMTLRQLLAWPRLPADPALINPPVVRALPVAALLWALGRLAWRWRRLDGPLRRQVGLWTAVLLLSVWLITPWSRPAWDAFSLLNQTLYPWRFLGMASLAAALLLGAAVAADLRAGWRANWLTAVLTVGIVATAVPWLYPPREPVPEAPTLADLADFEQPPLFIGTTTLGEFLPRWVAELPDTQALRQELATTGDPDRLSPHPAVAVQRRAGPPWNAAYTLQVAEPTTLTYRQFYFPGWEAALNGRPLALRPSHPHGLIQLELPAGLHSLHVAFKNTWPRRLGESLTLFGLLLSPILLLILRRFTLSPPRFVAAPPPHPSSLSLPHLGVLALLPLAVWAFFTLVDTPLRRATLYDDGVYNQPRITPLDFAGELRLLTFAPQAARVAADEPVTLTLYWRALRPIGVTYDVGVQIWDAQGVVWSRPETERPFDWRFVSGNEPWPPDGYRMDPFVLRLLDGAPPGLYTFHVGLVRRDTQQTVATHTFGQLVVDRPARAERPLEAGMTPPPAAAVAQGLQLLGARLDRSEANPGDPLRLTLLWQVVDPAQAPADGSVTLTLRAANGAEMLQKTVAIASAYPPAQWQRGDRLRTEALLRLPAALPAGDYRWQAGLVGAEPWPVGNLRLRQIERLWTAPALDVTAGITLGDVAALSGAQASPQMARPGAAWPVTLVWRSLAETETSYRVFLHLLGPDGQLVAQSDGEPANWTRATTGWRPGEVVLDARVVDIPPDAPPGEYTLAAGLYNPDDGARLTAVDGRDAVVLMTLTLP
jgi:hypothetical protein